MFNTYNPTLTSGIVALDLFNNFQKKGHKVKLLVNRYDPKYLEGVVSMETFFSSLIRTILFKFQWRYDKLKMVLKLREKENTDPNC